MKILWVVGFVVPQAARMVGRGYGPFGGWVSAMIQALAQVPDIELGVAMRAPVKKLVSERIDNVQYFALPQCGRNNHDVRESDCRSVLDQFQPDLLHIEGTECQHSLTFITCWPGKNVVELQGILNGIAPYQLGGLPIPRMLLSFNPSNVVVAATLLLNKRLRFRPRMKNEVRTIQLAQNLIGRTLWDRAHSFSINPQAEYFRCNHILGSSFSEVRWELNRIERYRIFVGNAAAPLKGAHFACRAVAHLVREYPSVRLVIAGESPYPTSKLQYKKFIGYAAYLRRLVKELNLANHVEFVGVLQEEQMASQMSESHVFLMSSVIENSPVTLGEAMSLGVPAVVSFSGGTPDMARDEKEALFYRDNDPVMLACQLKRIFDDDHLAVRLSENGVRRASAAHNQTKNLNATLKAYRTILGRP